MIPTPLQLLAGDCGAELRGNACGVMVQRVCTDSRSLRRGDLFVCLRGPHFDGHAFAAEACRQGAAAVLGEPGFDGLAGLDRPVLLVPDARQALGQIARAHRRRFQIPVIAVAGSNGKTTTKELIASILRQRWHTVASVASFNNEIGLPLTLLELDATHGAAVVEVGTNHPGELAALLPMAEPTHGVLTRLGREHLEFFGNLEGVIQEEGALAEAVPSEGVLVLSGDGPGVTQIGERAQARVVRVGWAPENDWACRSATISTEGTAFDVRPPAQTAAAWGGEYTLRLLGVHQLDNALLGLALGCELGLSRDEVAAGLRSCGPAPRRLQLATVGGVGVLDDSYNANADSMRAALAVLRDLDCAGRRIAVLGDMVELGDHAASAHEETGRHAVQMGVDRLYAVGEWAGRLLSGAREQRLPWGQDFASAPGAAEKLLEDVREGDVVLVKASRRTRLDVVADLLKRELAARPAGRWSARHECSKEACSTT